MGLLHNLNTPLGRAGSGNPKWQNIFEEIGLFQEEEIAEADPETTTPEMPVGEGTISAPEPPKPKPVIPAAAGGGGARAAGGGGARAQRGTGSRETSKKKGIGLRLGGGY